jgi:hypothetical protein
MTQALELVSSLLAQSLPALVQQFMALAKDLARLQSAQPLAQGFAGDFETLEI